MKNPGCADDASARPTRIRSDTAMAEFGISMFPTDYAIQPVELARGRRARLRVDFLSRAYAYPRFAKNAVARRRRLAERVLAYARSVRRAGRGRGGHQEAQTRHRRMPGDRARSDRAREGSRVARHDFRRPRDFRNRRGLERRGDGESRRAVQEALENGQGKDPRDARDLDQRGGRVSRRVRELRSDLVVSQTGAGGRPAGPAGIAIAARPSIASPSIATDGCRSIFRATISPPA